MRLTLVTTHPTSLTLIIIDECHRGGANDESSWRDVLDYFSPAVQLGLTATPKRKTIRTPIDTLVTLSTVTR